ncbi:MAG: transcription factor FapR [Synergistes sp.]|nr:transcription factor FapR [Synergistes sp.]
MQPMSRKERQKRLSDLIETKPLMTDEELSSELGVSLSTVRLDRALLSIPELRERTKIMAGIACRSIAAPFEDLRNKARAMSERAASRLRSLCADEVVGDLIGLEPDKMGISMLATTDDMSFRKTSLVDSYYIYAQAATLAIASINAAMVIVDAARVKYNELSHVGDKIVAHSKVGAHKGSKYAVSVRSFIDDREIFVGRFILAAADSQGAGRREAAEC